MQPLRSRIAHVLALVLAVGMTFGLGSGSALSHQVAVEPATPVELAQALTAALNGRDIDTLLDLFTDEDAGPTVNADRFAWQKFEIRLWAEMQGRAGLHVEAFDYRTTPTGAVWHAFVDRDDWRDLGIDNVLVSNSIWVHQGKIADFTSVPDDSRDLERLRASWRPGMAPEWTLQSWDLRLGARPN
jgi:hypothetical protein